MIHVADEIVEEALRELSDEHAQARLWSSVGGTEVSLLAEAKSRLWDDSVLSDAMDRGVAYNDEVDTQLRRLRVVLHRVDENAPVGTFLASPDLASARSLARELLDRLRQFGYDRAGP